MFLICLCLATFFWLLNSLGHSYVSNLECNIEYKNQPKGKVVLNELPKKINIQIKGLGFDLLAYKLSFSTPILKIDLSRIGGLTKSNGLNYNTIASSSYSSSILNQLGDQLEIKSIYPDSILFITDKEISKQVKIVPLTDLNFEKQYQLFGEILIKPTITTIYGGKSIIDTINEVYTENLNYNKLSQTVTESVGFNEEYKRLKIRMEPNKALIHIPVEKFTEYSKSITIETINVPDSVSLKTITKEVDIKFMLPLSKMANLASAKFKAIVDYNKINNNFSHKLKIELIDYPDYIQAITITPAKVEYIIKK